MQNYSVLSPDRQCPSLLPGGLSVPVLFILPCIPPHLLHPARSKLEKIDIQWDLLQKVFEDYTKSREFVYEGRKPKDVCLMDLGTIVAKELKQRGVLKNLDESEEINACSFRAEILA